jgi:WD40 repeat protein
MAPALVPKPVREFEGHADDVLDLAWSRGDMLLSASVDGQVTPLDE